MRRPTFRSSHQTTLAAIVATLMATGAGAATLHRFAITQTTGSEGAQAVLQTSPSGSALQGEVGGTSANTSIKVPFGMLGEYDPAGSTFGAGTLGISTTGYGVAGESFGTQPSVLGFAGGEGAGIEGVSNGGSGVSSAGVLGVADDNGDGGNFSAVNGFGVVGETLSGNVAGAGFNEYESGGVGLLGLITGEGVEAQGYSGSAMHPALSAVDEVGGSDLLGTYSCVGISNCSNQESFIVQGGSANRSGDTAGYRGASDVQISGDLYVYGRVYENCLAFPATSSTDCTDSDYANSYTTSGTTRSAGGNDVTVYGDAQSVRTIEDFGQGQLSNGRAYVHLDPAFARTTAPGAPYLVFLTPEGDSRGVFTANHSASGFEVRENGGGRSSLTFDYRIVAKPLGDTSRRFVAVAPKPQIPGYNTSHHRRGYKSRPRFNPTQNIIAPVALKR